MHELKSYSDIARAGFEHPRDVGKITKSKRLNHGSRSWNHHEPDFDALEEYGLELFNKQAAKLFENTGIVLKPITGESPSPRSVLEDIVKAA